MYISHKSNAIQTLQDSEWECRRTSKGLTNSEYWTWIATITTQDKNGNNVITYPSEDFTIVECIDEDDAVPTKIGILRNLRQIKRIFFTVSPIYQEKICFSLLNCIRAPRTINFIF